MIGSILRIAWVFCCLCLILVGICLGLTIIGLIPGLILVAMGIFGILIALPKPPKPETSVVIDRENGE